MSDWAQLFKATIRPALSSRTIPSDDRSRPACKASALAAAGPAENPGSDARLLPLHDFSHFLKRVSGAKTRLLQTLG
jgi:hypothetical protein